MSDDLDHLSDADRYRLFTDRGEGRVRAICREEIAKAEADALHEAMHGKIDPDDTITLPRADMQAIVEALADSTLVLELFLDPNNKPSIWEQNGAAIALAAKHGIKPKG